MDYEGIESLVEECMPTLELIDQKELMWQYAVRNLKKVGREGYKESRNHCLEAMQAPLCLASAIQECIAFSEKYGYSVFEVSLEERYDDMILKGITKDGAACEFFQRRGHVNDSASSFVANDIVVFVDGKETARYSIPDYRKELFEKDRNTGEVISDALSWLRRRMPRKKTKAL